MSILDAVLKVLAEKKRPMSADELTKLIVGNGLWMPETKTPIASVGAALYSDILTSKRTAPSQSLRKQGMGTFP